MYQIQIHTKGNSVQGKQGLILRDRSLNQFLSSQAEQLRGAPGTRVLSSASYPVRGPIMLWA